MKNFENWFAFGEIFGTSIECLVLFDSGISGGR